jgi:hypothetical protein
MGAQARIPDPKDSKVRTEKRNLDHAAIRLLMLPVAVRAGGFRGADNESQAAGSSRHHQQSRRGNSAAFFTEPRFQPHIGRHLPLYKRILTRFAGQIFSRQWAVWGPK